jgi:hypothetical protein
MGSDGENHTPYVSVVHAIQPQGVINVAGFGCVIMTHRIIARFSSVDHCKPTCGGGKSFQISTHFEKKHDSLC